MDIKKSKKGQITIFIILALAIVIVLILILIRKENLPIGNPSKTPIDEIKDCAVYELKNSTEYISNRGGTFKFGNSIMYNGTNISYLCYSNKDYETCIMQNPLLKESMEKELNEDLEPKIFKCLQNAKDSLEKRGYIVTYKKPVINVQFIPNTILLNIDSDLKIKKANIESYKNIRIDINSKMYELVMITTSILNWEARYGDAEIINYMMYYPELKLNKLKLDDGSTIYNLLDKSTNERFVFASRSFVIPPGVTGK